MFLDFLIIVLLLQKINREKFLNSSKIEVQLRDMVLFHKSE